MWETVQAAAHGFPTAEQPQLNQQQLLSHKQAACEGASQDSGHRGTLRFITQEDGLDICLLHVSPFSYFLYPPPQTLAERTHEFQPFGVAQLIGNLLLGMSSP